MKMITSKDLLCIQDQIGRPPKGAEFVAKRNSRGEPIVVKVRPLIKGAPFPTLYWLTCPTLKKEISHIEKTGIITNLEAQPNIQAGLEFDHLRYQKQRFEFMDELGILWKELPESKLKMLKNTGIGGIRDFTRVKCLHLHFAHYLADNNTVGSFIEKEFGLNRFY